MTVPVHVRTPAVSFYFKVQRPKAEGELMQRLTTKAGAVITASTPSVA
jgi:hypothetical protein